MRRKSIQEGSIISEERKPHVFCCVYQVGFMFPVFYHEILGAGEDGLRIQEGYLHNSYLFYMLCLEVIEQTTLSSSSWSGRTIVVVSTTLSAISVKHFALGGSWRGCLHKPQPSSRFPNAWKIVIESRVKLRI